MLGVRGRARAGAGAFGPAGRLRGLEGGKVEMEAVGEGDKAKGF